MSNAYKREKMPFELVLIVGVAILLGLFWTVIPAQQSNLATEKVPVFLQEGQILDLANLPESVVLPNGMILKDVSVVERIDKQGIVSYGTISATATFEKEASPLKMIWLDENGDGISYSSHTVLNSPPFGVEGSGGQINIWPLFGAKKVKFEVWG